MNNGEKLYHLANVVAIPATVLSGILMIKMGYMADANQISMSGPVLILSSVLWMIVGAGVLWIVVSSFMNKNLNAKLAEALKGKSYTSRVLFIALMILCALTPVCGVALAILSIYLFAISTWTLIHPTKEY